MGTVTDDFYTVTDVHEHLSDSGLKSASQHLFISWSYCPHYCCLIFLIDERKHAPPGCGY